MSTTAPAPTAPSERPFLARLGPYVRLARVDHWFKNAFMLFGALLALFYDPSLFSAGRLTELAFAFLCTCIVASSNYVLNEYLDAHRDRLHPKKKDRPAARGEIRGSIAVLEWLALGVVGVGLSFQLNLYFGLAALALWIMGCVYNIPPIRTKELPYIDVLSESLNNPIRLLLGWHALVTEHLPPVSLLIAYWMFGAFFMASKRFAEYRDIGDPEVAAAYRRSFAHYDENRLLVSMMFYIITAAFFAGIFIVRYKLELLIAVPSAAGFASYYLSLALRPNSPVQNPERLHHEPLFMIYSFATLALFVLIMFTDIPLLYSLFNVEPASFEPLWRLGG